MVVRHPKFPVAVAGVCSPSGSHVIQRGGLGINNHVENKEPWTACILCTVHIIMRD